MRSKIRSVILPRHASIIPCAWDAVLSPQRLQPGIFERSTSHLLTEHDETFKDLDVGNVPATVTCRAKIACTVPARSWTSVARASYGNAGYRAF